jgi:hypothetical protein
MCHETACPRCHLVVPRMLLESPTLFVSIFGAPSSGKSFFLAAMTHRLRKTMPRVFALNFSDADPTANVALHEAENALFSAYGGNTATRTLPKTDVVGDRYQAVDFGGPPVLYPRPFFFQVSPGGGHALEESPAEVARVICLYDNAGESFEPGADLPGSPVTQHMARSGCLLFVLDPLQEATFRERLGMEASLGVVSRQDVLFAEAARRIRQYRGLAATDRHDCPLVVVVSKFDRWQQLAGGRRLPDPWTRPPGTVGALRSELLHKVSQAVRDLLLRFMPTIVTTAESFVEPRRIVYVPVSATGVAVLGSGHAGQAGSLKPMWSEVPLLQALASTVPGLVPEA